MLTYQIYKIEIMKKSDYGIYTYSKIIGRIDQ